MPLARTTDGPVRVSDRPLRLLVVDDDPILLELALAQLAQPGCAVITASDGAIAWDRLERSAEPFDIILCDLEMPVLDGFGLLQGIRASPRHRHLPVVVITSRDDTFAIDRSYELGATSFVSKPLNWRLLGYQLRYVLRSSRMEGELRAARDEAERTSDLKRSLLTLLQHETRTPLHAIIGFTELLRGGLADRDTLREHAERVLDAARDLNSTLGRVFYFAQIAAGTVLLDREVLPLAAVAEEAVQAARSTAAAAGVSLAFEDGGAGDVRVACDLRHLAKALRELIDNAVRHAPEGSSVDIRVAREGPNDVTVAVLDRGPGLEPDALRRCLEAFAQGGDPLTRSANGLGLGLPTVQAITALMGGRLALARRPEGGVRATLTFPAVAVATVQAT